MIIGITKEIGENENRVAITPENVSKLVKKGLEIHVQAGAGEGSSHPDSQYSEAGAKIVSGKGDVLGTSDVLFCINCPVAADEISSLKAGSVIIGLCDPLGSPENLKNFSNGKHTIFSAEMIPRTTRAQSMDVLSSQASIAGYKAVLIAAESLPKYFPMLTTAAGTIRPAKVFVMGAGVAGLQAIATAKRLGAEVQAFDVRPAVKEEVQSLGAKFFEMEFAENKATEGGYAKELSAEEQQKTREALLEAVSKVDVVITTAQVPGKKAPILIDEKMLSVIKPGSVIVDLAANQGGNVVGAKPGETVNVNGVNIIGPVNLPSTVPVHASQLYSNNLRAFVELLIGENGELKIDFEDEILKGSCVVKDGEIYNERVKGLLD